MKWMVKFHDEFKVEFDELDQEVKDELLAEAKFVERFGPETSRPHVDTLQGSHYANMKELRFEANDGEWRLPSTPNARQSCSLLPTRRASASVNFTNG